MTTLSIEQVPIEDDITTLSWALLALRAAVERHRLTREQFGRADATVRPLAYASMVEAAWWIAALDERLWQHHGTSYQNLRDADDFGKAALGVVWARDRHTHQLGHTTGRDDRSFFDPEPGGVLYISRGFIWRPAHEIAQADPRKDFAHRRAAYEAEVAERPSIQPIARAEGWFTSFAKIRGSVLIDG